MAAVERHRWIVDYDRSPLASAACITLVRGADVPRVVAAFGGDPEAAPAPLEGLPGHELVEMVAVGDGFANEVRSWLGQVG